MTSIKSIPEKLHLKPGQVLAVINAPDGYESMLGPLPHGCRMERRMDPGASVVQLFVTTKAMLEKELSEMRKGMSPGRAVWVTYPKGSSGVETDLNRDIIWSYAREIGMDAVSNFALDEVWSALRLKSI